MDLLRHRLLLIPIVLFAVLFAVDKIFYIKAVRDRVLLYKKVEPDLYDSRHDLLKQLVADLDQRRQRGRRTGVILGSSRSAEFHTLEVEKILPGTDTYNFSVPMGGIAHAYYFADLLKKNGVKPDFIMLEADLISFSSPSLSFGLQYDFDPAFILENTNFLNPDDPLTGGFRPDETDTFFLKYLFALYRYPLNPRNVVENYSQADGFVGHNNLDFRWHHQNMIALTQKDLLGAIPNPLLYEAPESALIRDAAMVRGRVLGDGRPSATQRLLFEKLLAHVREEKIPLLIYQPVISYPFEKVIDEIDDSFQKRKIEDHVAGMEGVYYSDPEKHRKQRLKCRAFVDALHLSGSCYSELTPAVFSPLQSVLATKK